MENQKRITPIVLLLIIFGFELTGQSILNQKIIKSPSIGMGVTSQGLLKGVYATYAFPLVYKSKIRWFVTFDVERIENEKLTAIQGNVLFEEYKLTLNNAAVGIALYTKPRNEFIRSFINVRAIYGYPEETTESDVFQDVHMGAVSVGGGLEIRVSNKLFFQNSIELGFREWFGDPLPQRYTPERFYGQLKFGVRYYLKRRIANFKG